MGKRYRKNNEIVDSEKKYDVDMAFDILSKFQTAKFDETINVAIRLGINPQQAEQMVRGAVVLPHGVGKKVRVLVFAKGEKEKEGRNAGADYVGSDDLIEKITKENWLDFDKVIATPDMMGTVSKLGKILGPRGLMPNPKLGTVTFEVARAVEDHKKGKVEYRNEKGGIVHTVIGKFSFGSEKLKENFMALMDALIHAKPASSKGTFIRSVAISLTHGPGINIEPLSLQRAVEA